MAVAVKPLDWRTAYFRQAQSDYEVYNHLRTQADIPFCHRLHYLQMATEKMAKGFLTPRNGPEYRHSHDALAYFVESASHPAQISRHPQIAKGTTDKNKKEAYKQYRKGLSGLALKLENLSPEGGHHPNPEYPWMDNAGQIQSPLSHPFPEFDPRTNPKMERLLTFVRICFAIIGDELGDE